MFVSFGSSDRPPMESYEFHILDAIEYWTERAANDEEIITVLRCYMPDVLYGLEPHAKPPYFEPLLLPTPVDEPLIKTVDPDGKQRLAALGQAVGRFAHGQGHQGCHR